MVNTNRKYKNREREVTNLYKAWGFDKSNRDPSILENQGGETGRDNEIRFPDGKLLPLCVQTKVGDQVSIWKALDEARSAAYQEELPVAHVKRTTPPFQKAYRIVVLDERSWVRLLGMLYKELGEDKLIQLVGEVGFEDDG